MSPVPWPPQPIKPKRIVSFGPIGFFAFAAFSSAAATTSPAYHAGSPEAAKTPREVARTRAGRLFPVPTSVVLASVEKSGLRRVLNILTTAYPGGSRRESERRSNGVNRMNVCEGESMRFNAKTAGPTNRAGRFFAIDFSSDVMETSRVIYCRSILGSIHFDFALEIGTY